MQRWYLWGRSQWWQCIGTWFPQKNLFLNQDSMNNRNQTECTPRFFLAPILRKQALISSETGCFVVFGSKACPIPSPWWCSFRLSCGAGHARRQAGVHGSWAGFGCAWRSVSILHPSSHVAQLLTKVGLCLKLLHSFAYLLWKGWGEGERMSLGWNVGASWKPLLLL